MLKSAHRRSSRSLKAILITTVTVLALVGASCSTPPSGSSTPKDPVILVHGFTGCNVLEFNLEILAGRLRNAGHSVSIFGYGDCGFGDIRDNAVHLSNYVDAILNTTGADSVDLVGFSMGGLVSRYFIKHLGGVDKVDSLVTMGTPHYGSEMATLAKFLLLGDCIGIIACQQMSPGSSFLNELNDGPDALPGVDVTAITTFFDEISFPHTNGHVRDGHSYRNITIQDQCPLRIPGHLLLAVDGAAASGVIRALNHQSIQLDCFAL